MCACEWRSAMSASICSFCYYSIILAQSRTMEDTTASLANKSARRRAQRADYRQQQKSTRLAAKEAASKDSEFTASEQGRLEELERGMRLISSAGSSTESRASSAGQAHGTGPVECASQIWHPMAQHLASLLPGSGASELEVQGETATQHDSPPFPGAKVSLSSYNRP